MQMHQEDRQIMTNVNNSSGFTIQNNAKMFSILSSGIYEDPIRAIIRELSCNAIDSHIEAGKGDTPFRVKLPSRFDPRLQIEDYGIGLDHEGVTQLYTTYGMSTKTSSNDVIGALGLGSKTPFSYSETFSIRARKDGTERWYNAYIGNEGFPSISMLSEQTTEEPNGVMIEVAVKESDCNRFREKAIDVYSVFKITPDGLPDSVQHTIKNTSVKLYESFDVVGYHTIRSDQMNIFAVMGNIAYRIPLDVVGRVRGDLLNFVKMKHGERQSVYLPFDIGELDIAASRESLSFSETEDDRTHVAIQNRLDETIGRYIKEVQNDIDACVNWVEACKYIHRESLIIVAPLFTYQGRSMKRWLDDRFCFENILVKRTTWDSTKWNSFNLVPYNFRSFGSVGSTTQKTLTIDGEDYATKGVVLYYNDTGETRGIVSTLQWIRGNPPEGTLGTYMVGVIDPISKGALKRIKSQLPGIDMRPISPVVNARKAEMEEAKKNQRTIDKYNNESEVKARYRNGYGNMPMIKHDIQELRDDGVRLAYYLPPDGRNVREWDIDGNRFPSSRWNKVIGDIVGVDRILYANKTNIKRIKKNNIPNIVDVIKKKSGVLQKLLDAYTIIEETPNDVDDISRDVVMRVNSNESCASVDKYVINQMIERKYVDLDFKSLDKEKRLMAVFGARHLIKYSECVDKEVGRRLVNGLRMSINLFRRQATNICLLIGHDAEDRVRQKVETKYDALASCVDKFYEDYPIMIMLSARYDHDLYEPTTPQAKEFVRLVNGYLDNWT